MIKYYKQVLEDEILYMKVRGNLGEDLIFDGVVHDKLGNNHELNLNMIDICGELVDASEPSTEEEFTNALDLVINKIKEDK